MTQDTARFGLYGGRYVPETLMPALVELEAAYAAARADAAFQSELDALLCNYSGRPTPLYLAHRFGEHYCGGGAAGAGRAGGALSAGESDAGSVDAGIAGGAAGVRIYLKREDLNHTGAHKINNCLGQGLLARRMGKRRIVAETGAGQHGVATATVAALFGMECTVYMGEVDMARQRPNVLRMRLLGADIVPVLSGTRTLKDATNETIRDWVTNVRTTHYIIGSTVGPHPYPTIVRDFQSVIGRETREQILSAEGRLPDDVVACVGGGSNALGIFTAFVNDKDVRLHGVEAGGSPDGHAAALLEGRPGVLHGAYSYLMQDDDGQVLPAHSIAPGLDYPGVGPEHAALKDSGRVVYGKVSDIEALQAFQDLSRLEGILPALESSHAAAYIRPLLKDNTRPDRLVVVNLSGRGDKDIEAVEERIRS